MKKLSLIMAVLMIIMCMPVMALTSVSAVEPATEADPIVDLTIPEGTTVEEANAVGYVLDNGEEVYVDTLAHAADIARANIGTQVILYLTKNYEATKTIGYAYSGCESVCLSGGADLVIDGQNLYSIVSVMTGSNPGRLFRFNDDDNNDGTGSITFRNITLNTGTDKAGGNLEFSAGSLKLVTFKNAEIITPTINNNNFCFVVKTNIVLDNVTRADCKSRPALYLDGTLTADIKNFKVNNVNAVVMGASNTAGNITLNIDGLTATNVNYNVIESVKGSITVKNATATVNNKAFFDKITADISISDSTVNAPALCGETISGKVTVNNVNFNATKTTSMIAATSLIYNIDAEVVINSAVVSASALFNNVKKKVTVNDVTLTGAGIAFDNVAADVTVNSGNYTCSNMFAKLTGNGVNFTVNNGTFNDCSNGSNAAFRVQSSNNIINLVDGTFNIAQHGIVHMQDDAVSEGVVTTDYTKNNNTVNIYGGVYTVDAPVSQVGILDEAKDSSNNTYNIYNGVFEMKGTDGRMFVFNNGADNTNVNININGGIFSAHKNMFSLRNAPNLNVNISGGVFENGNNADEMFWLDNGAAKTIAINGGTFNSLNRTGEASDATIVGTANDYSQGVHGIIYSVSAGAAITVNGGTFNLYGENEETVVDGGVHILTRGNAKSVTVLGGTFNGGQYVNVHAPKVDLSAATKAAMPESKTVTLNPTTTKGASVRTAAETSGIRFQGTVSKYSMDFLKTFYADADVYCGVAIVPADYLEQTGGVFTFAALEAKELAWATTNAVDGLIDNEDGTYTVRIALVDIKDTNLERDFVAIAYAYADTDADGKVSANDAVIYADGYSNERNIVETAKAALADVQTESGTYGESVYNTAVTEYYYVEESDGTFTKTTLEEGEVKYSKYSEAQLEVLKKYA